MQNTKGWKFYLGLTISPLFITSCFTTSPVNGPANEEEPIVTQNSSRIDSSVWRSCENDNTPGVLNNPDMAPVSDMYVYDLPGESPVDEIPITGQQTAPISQQSMQMIQGLMPPPPEPVRVITITHGDPVYDSKEYPFMAQLRIDLTDGFSLLRSQCGGTLISDQWIMTAAHCIDVQYAQDRYNSSLPSTSTGVTFDLHKVSVGLGEVTISAMAGSRIDASKALCHKDYNATGNLENDIALLRLDAPIDVTSNLSIQVANLPLQGDDALNQLTDFIAKPIGYGKTETGSTSDRLLVAELTVDSSQTQPTLFTAFQYNETVSVCNGDSGGSIFTDGGIKKILGISSFIMTPDPNSCNFPEIPSSFTRVSAYRNDMDDAITNCTSDDSCFN
ncbi:MAG: S1 family serine peptidase [Maricaulaceae bacterium]